MSGIYNDPNKTNQEKKDLINRTVQNAKASGISTRDQMKDLRNAGKTYNKAL